MGHMHLCGRAQCSAVLIHTTKERCEGSLSAIMVAGFERAVNAPNTVWRPTISYIYAILYMRGLEPYKNSPLGHIVERCREALSALHTKLV